MKAGQLRDTIAAAMLVPASAVQITMRNIREKGMLTTGAHGVNAPDMSYLDAARVLTAQIVENAPGRRAPRHVQEIGGLRWANPDFAWRDDPFTITQMLPKNSTDTFEQAVASLIQIFSECTETEAFRDAGRLMRDGSFLNPLCRVEIFAEDGAARIQMAGAEYSFFELRPITEHRSEADDQDFRLGRQAISFVNQEVIARIAAAFREAGCD